MEIFQTIWNALITENVIAMTIISVPCIFLEAYLYMLIFLTILRIDSSKRSRFVFVTLFSIVSILNTYFGVMPYNTFINALAIPVLVLLVFRASILKSILSELIMFATVFIFSTSLVSLYSTVLDTTPYVTSIIPLHKLCFSIIFYITLFLFYKLCKKINIKLSILDKFKHKINTLLIINFVIGSVAIGIEYYIIFSYIDLIPQHLVFATLSIISLYFAISMFSLIRTNKLEITTQNLEEQKMYNKTLSTLHDNIRGFKHDFNNIIQAVGGYLSTDNIDGLRTYYTDLLEECQINNNLAVLNPELINNPVIYSLLADKYYRAEKLDIKINLEVMMDLSNLNIKPYELTRILGVLLDNAVESASKCDNGVVNITFRTVKNLNKDLIIIQNSYTNKDIDINRIFEKGYTSKQDNEKDKEHGLGLWEVHKYLKKNSHLNLHTTKTDDFFSQQFEIYN